MELEGFSTCFINCLGVTWPFTLEEKVVNRFLNLWHEIKTAGGRQRFCFLFVKAGYSYHHCMFGICHRAGAAAGQPGSGSSWGSTDQWLVPAATLNIMQPPRRATTHCARVCVGGGVLGGARGRTCHRMTHMNVISEGKLNSFTF